MRKVKTFILLPFFLLAVVFPDSTPAEYIPPGEVDITTERYVPEKQEFLVGTYQYDVNWEAIPVGSAKVEVYSKKINGEDLGL